MPRVDIAEENRTGEGGEKFPRLKLETGGKSRFVMFERPWMEWVHRLEAPVIEDGQGVKIEKEKRNGEKYSVWKTSFVSSPLCIGDQGTLRDKGIDEKNCPGCEASAKSGGDIPKPVQRFSANVIVYDLRGTSWDIRTPFSADIKLWAFTARMYDDLIGLQKKLGGDLRKIDLTLECEDGKWQRNKLSFDTEPGYLQAPAGYIKDLINGEGNKASDEQLRDACGFEYTRSRIQDDVDNILLKWNRVRRGGAVDTSELDSAGSLDGGLDDLLGGSATTGTPSPVPENQEAKVSEAAEDLFGAFGDPFPASPEAAPQKPAPSSETASANATQAAPASVASTPAVPPSEDDDPFAANAVSETVKELKAEVQKEIKETTDSVVSSPKPAATGDAMSFEDLINL